MTDPTSILLASPDDAAGMIGGFLAWRNGPATAVLAGLSGTEITVKITNATYFSLGADMRRVYGVPEHTTMYERTGELWAGNVLAALVGLSVVSVLIPATAFERIQNGEPAGSVLGSRMKRTSRKINIIDGPEIAVETSAVLTYNGVRVGNAREVVTRGFCDTFFGGKA